jgi:hypothetical protein
MQCGQSVQLLNVKLLVHHVTSRLYEVKYTFSQLKSQHTFNIFNTLYKLLSFYLMLFASLPMCIKKNYLKESFHKRFCFQLVQYT